MTTITGSTTAWLTYHGDIRSLRDQKPDELVSSLGYSTNDMTSHGWIAIGQAEVRLVMPAESVLLSNQIEALRLQQREALAKAEDFEQRIKKLLAISYEPSEA